jgi:hypothetical protein
LFKNYGVKYPSQSEKIKQKRIETCLKTYGVEHPYQDPNILDKNIKSCYRTKQYKLPSGNIIMTQGYEHLGLDEIIYKEKLMKIILLWDQKMSLLYGILEMMVKIIDIMLIYLYQHKIGVLR